MGFFDVFFGTPQSLYASYAILAAIITICITILLTGTDLTLGNRFLFIFLVVLMLIPSVFLTLFQITCMVTGGNKNTRWWCWLYAWIMSVFIIIYCVFVIIVSFTSLFTYTNAITKVEHYENQYAMNQETSNEYAKSMIENFEDSNNDLPPGLPPPGAKSRNDEQSEENFNVYAFPPAKQKKNKFTDYSSDENFANQPSSVGPPSRFRPRSPTSKIAKFTDYSSEENFQNVTYMDMPKPGDKAKPRVELPPEEIAVLPSTASFTDYDDKYANF